MEFNKDGNYIHNIKSEFLSIKIQKLDLQVVFIFKNFMEGIANNVGNKIRSGKLICNNNIRSNCKFHLLK